MRKFLATAAIAAGAALAVTGCGLDSGQPVTYAPAAYGVAGHCYYIQDPAEAIALEAAGLCPRGWVPTLAPLYWQQEYYDYYSSPAYYGHYVPSRIRTVYVSREHSFGTAYRSSIRTASARARYKGSDGSVATGARVARAKARFGSGTAGTSYGGGKRNSNVSNYKPANKAPAYKPVKAGGYGGGKH